MLATSTDRALRSVGTAIEQRTVDTLSLDVFDTVLLRRVARPVDAFRVLGSELTEDGPGAVVRHAAPLRRGA